MLLFGQISKPLFGRVESAREASRKSQKLLPFVKKTKNGGVPIHLKVHRYLFKRNISVIFLSFSQWGQLLRKEFAPTGANSFLEE